MNRFRPAASIDLLRQRAQLLSRLRSFFQARGFWEVETPLLGSQTVVDRYLDPIAAECPVGPLQARKCWLQTSPELNMKRLLAAGSGDIYQIGRAFRRDELGPLHNPEFTLVEWYRVGDDLDAGIDFLSDLCEEMLTRGRPTRLSYHDAFDQVLAIDPHTASVEQLRAAARTASLPVPATLSDDRDDWLDLLLVELIQPQLGRDQPVVLHDYPASQAALAVVRDGTPAVAERFELFVQGIELANGYHELLSPGELTRRQRLANQRRVEDGKTELPTPQWLIEAMEHGLPACAGVALGFDRLVMLALGVSSIESVMAFPFDRV